MNKKMKLASKVFTGSSSYEAEEMADKWLSSYVRELREFRKAWNSRNGMFNVECVAVVSETLEG